MTQETFDALCADMRRLWTPAEGLVVQLESAIAQKCRIAVGPVTNDGLVAERCVLWGGRRRLYEGTIHNPELLGALHTIRACVAMYTTSRMLSRKRNRYLGSRRLLDCSGCPKAGDCALRREGGDA